MTPLFAQPGVEMSLIRPFTGLRPAPGRAADVIAPPYDVLNTDEARVRAAGKPWSFAHLKPELTCQRALTHGDAVTSWPENFLTLTCANGSSPYMYTVLAGAHQQTGISSGGFGSDYDSNRIRKHEFTRPDKEDDRARQIEAPTPKPVGV
jgi:uncharacterized protein (DUF1015 family)